MENLLLIFCIVLSSTIVKGLVTKQEGTEVLVKDFINALIQQHGNKYSNRNIYTAVKEEIANMGDNGDKDAFIDGIRLFIKAKRLRHADLGIVKRSVGGMEDLHARGINTTTPAAVTPPQTPPTSSTTTVTPATAATTAKTTPTPTITFPKIDFCKLFLFACKSNVKKGWFFNG